MEFDGFGESSNGETVMDIVDPRKLPSFSDMTLPERGEFAPLLTPR
jgi:hypothetical protein